jgi:hypothetical protein
MTSVIREAVRLLRDMASVACADGWTPDMPRGLETTLTYEQMARARGLAAALEKLVTEPDRATVERGARALADADGLHQCKLSLAVQGCPIGDAHHLQCDCRRMVRAVLHSLGSDAP